MKAFLALLVPASILLLGNPTTAYANAERCQALVSSAPKSVYIDTVMSRPTQDVGSDFCLVKGVMSQHLGADNQFYGIRFELRLPNYWKGRFAYQFNVGMDGTVKPALGAMTGLTKNEYAINQGFAVVSSNAGHFNRDTSKEGIMAGANFAHDPKARRDYGYLSVEKLNGVARTLVEAYYDKPIKHAYGIGQANGGRMAMVVASRYPDMFDGLLAGYPAFNAPKAALQHVWDVQTLHKLNEDIRASLERRDLDFLSHHLLEQCDGLDGVNDDMIFAVEACQARFDPASFVCESHFDQHCLSVEKVLALIQMHKGPHNSENKALYASWIYDAGIRSNNWYFWKVQSDVEGWNDLPAGLVAGGAALAHMYTTPFTRVLDDALSLKAYLMKFDLDKDAEKIFATSAAFPESAMTLMTPLDAVKPKLTGFKKAGGKMMIFHGNSDPVSSVKDTTRWYDFLNFHHKDHADEFVRFYRIPGMPHGQGGPSTDQFNMLQPLVQWVEQGKAPKYVLARTRTNNSELTARMLGISRPLCSYPYYAHYKAGNTKSANSFICADGR